MQIIRNIIPFCVLNNYVHNTAQNVNNRASTRVYRRVEAQWLKIRICVCILLDSSVTITEKCIMYLKGKSKKLIKK